MAALHIALPHIAGPCLTGPPDRTAPYRTAPNCRAPYRRTPYRRDAPCRDTPSPAGHCRSPRHKPLREAPHRVLRRESAGPALPKARAAYTLLAETRSTNECSCPGSNQKNPWHDLPEPATFSPLATGSPPGLPFARVRNVDASPSRPVACETSPPHAAMPPHRVRPPIACRRHRNGSHARGIHSHSAYAPSVKRWHLNIRAFSLLR